MMNSSSLKSRSLRQSTSEFRVCCTFEPMRHCSIPDGVKTFTFGCIYIMDIFNVYKDFVYILSV